MKRIVLISTLLLITAILFGQNFDRLAQTKQIGCSDIANNSSLQYIKYMQSQQLDSAQYLLNYWQEKCGEREPVLRAKILLALQTGNYKDSLLSESVLGHVFNFKNRMDMIKSATYFDYDNYTAYYGFIPPNQDFDKFTQGSAEQLKKKYPANSIEYLWADFYSGNTDSIFTVLQNTSYSNSTLTKRYDEIVDTHTKMGEVHIAGIVGLWVPTGDLSPLGLHPQLGFQMGTKKGKMNYDVSFSIAFIKAANEYTYFEDNQATKTSYFAIPNIGFDVGRDLFVAQKHEVQFTGGIAYEALTVRSADKDKDIESLSASTYNINAGLAYRYYIRSTFYIGMRAKYNFVDYSIGDVTNFHGQPITIQLTIGGLDNLTKRQTLQALQYKLRQ